MHQFLEILKYILPALVVLLTSWLMLKKFLDFNTKHLVVMQQNLELEKQKLDKESKSKKEEAFFPLKLQAYERLTLFLERINPPNLITRELKPGLNAGQFHKDLLSSIMEEFEHNMSQQIYISDAAWASIKNAKEEVMSIINKASKRVETSESAVKLGEAVLEESFGTRESAIDKALAILKNDLRVQFA